MSPFDNRGRRVGSKKCTSEETSKDTFHSWEAIGYEVQEGNDLWIKYKCVDCGYPKLEYKRKLKPDEVKHYIKKEK